MIFMRSLGRASALPSIQGTFSLGSTTAQLPAPAFTFPIDKLLTHSSHQTRTIFHQFHRHLHSFTQNYLSVATTSSFSTSSLHTTRTKPDSILNRLSFQQIHSFAPKASPCVITKKSAKPPSAAFSTNSICCNFQGANGEGGSPPGKASSITLPLQNALLSKEQADNFLRHLSDDQKKILYHSLNIEVLRDTKSGHLGSTPLESANYLSKFGRPTAAIIGGKEEPPELPTKWLHTRLVSADLSLQQEKSDEKADPVTAKAIWAGNVFPLLEQHTYFLFLYFLQSYFLLSFLQCDKIWKGRPRLSFPMKEEYEYHGDYIDLTIGAALGISTMAAAALGNTISDVAGIASAWYVEALAEKVGIHDPKLTPGQWNLWSVRWASNIGRAIGVVIGCLLGMVPLLFLPSAEEKKEREEAANALKEANKNASNASP